MRKMRLFLIVAFIAILLFLGFYANGVYSTGYRAGTMVKFSRKGVLFKTYEGELNLGMVLNDDPGKSPTSMGSIWRFSVLGSDTAVIRKIDDALLSGKRIKLRYNEMFMAAFWRGETKYMIDEAQVVK